MRKRGYTYIMILLLSVMILRPLSADAAENTLPRLVDNADILSDDEEEELLEKLDTISKERECDVVIVTADSLERKTSEAYADDFYDENGYGAGENADGILLLVSMENRDWAISTCGYGITAFTDAGQEYMTEQFLPYLSDGDYADAFEEFADLCDDFIRQADTGEPYDVGNLPEEDTHGLIPFWIGICFGASFLIMLIVALIRKSSLKTVTSNGTAEGYVKKDSLKFAVKEDLFLRERVTRRRIETDTNSSGSGGSSTHASSSGVTHGGSSGKF